MTKKISIAPIPVIFVDRPKLDESESLENLKDYLDINKKVNQEKKYPLDELNFTTKIGNTEYEVSTNFDISGKQTLMQQFMKIILSQN
ncbi:MAG: hypothetical protein E7621_05205 [Ruminococcaceae bacterium]|nr:hypothetical protein [Oscillospiraceae bacterium]